MKLRNLLYATMVACAFASCSKDDTEIVGPEGPNAELDATLTVAFNADGAKTKAIGSVEGATDAVITTIGIAVFNNGAMSPAMAEGALISYTKIDRAEGSTIDTTACVSAKSGLVKVVVVANPGEELGGYGTLTEFQGAVSAQALEKQINGNLLMSSKVYEMKLLPGRNVACTEKQVLDEKIDWKNGSDVVNFITAANDNPYKVYRNVAKITLGKISLKPRADFGENAKYAKFTLDSVYIDHARPKVLVFGDNTNAWQTVNYVSKLEEDRKFLTGRGEASLLDMSTKGKIANYGTGAADITANLSFYVYDNAVMGATNLGVNRATRLIVKGTYEYKTGNTPGGEGDIIKSENAYWYFEINNGDDAASSTGVPEHKGVLRNVEYLVNMDLTGPGEPVLPNPVDPIDPETPDPDPETPPTPGKAACIKVAVEVAAWGQVTQNPDID